MFWKEIEHVSAEGYGTQKKKNSSFSHNLKLIMEL